MWRGRWIWLPLPSNLLESMVDDPDEKVRESVRRALGRDVDGGHVWDGPGGDQWCRWCSAARSAVAGMPCPTPDGVPFGT